MEVMAAYGIDVSEHRSTPIDDLNLEDYQLILVMEHGHKESISVDFPAAADRVYLLSEMDDSHYDINDPVSGSLRDYSHSLDIIKQIIDNGYKRIEELAAHCDRESEASV